MFGMSSMEFWEGEPQLYWAYRFSFIKKQEFEANIQAENLKVSNWLNGKTTELAVSLAISNNFGKKKKDFPDFKEFYGKEKQELNEAQKIVAKQSKGIKDKNVIGQIEFNYWARN